VLFALLLLVLPGLAVAAPTLTEAEQRSLDRGGLVLQPADLPDGAGFVGYLRVPTPEQSIWDAVLDFEGIPDRTPGVASTKRYLDETHGSLRRIHVGYVLQLFGRTIRYHIAHRLEDGQLTWTLDAARDNDLQRLTGEFTVRPTDDASTQLLVYRAAMATTLTVPPRVRDFLTKRSLRGFLMSVRDDAVRRAAEAP
jgi:hypothetical protein